MVNRGLQGISWTMAVLFVSMFFLSCGKGDDAPVNPVETITTLRLILTETGSGTVKTFEYRDPDGPGGQGPVKFDPIILNTGRNYTCAVQLVDERNGGSVDLSAEIRSEGADHQFYFQVSGATINLLNFDMDIKGQPLGMTSTWTTGAASAGTLRVVLKHKPGIKTAGDTVAKGDTDIDILFNAVVNP